VSKNLVFLHLDPAAPAESKPSEATTLRRMLDEAFAALADVVAASDTTMPAEVTAAVERCRTALLAGVEAETLEPLAKSCFESTRATAVDARTRAAERRAQIATLVTMVRETVATIGGGHANLQETLADSAERFERLAQVGDLQQIQARLLDEVATLKRITLEQRQTWEDTIQQFGLRLARLETQLDHTRREAAIDPLTNVANRRTFERTCREWLEPNRAAFVMAMADVDDFKSINDRYGHVIGDRVLATVAETLVRSLRSDDMVARLGGDEFAVLAASLTLAQAQGRFATISRAVQDACRPLIPDGRTPTLSIGIAECSAGDTLQSLQHRADAALYDAKRNGKGRVAIKATPFIRDLLKGR
jgi:diguanylate cyclase